MILKIKKKKKFKTELELTKLQKCWVLQTILTLMLKAADFYILSSRYEGFPTVLFEAITLKKNIIATGCFRSSRNVRNGKLGLIVENSEEGIYEGMQKKALTEPESF